ncbi:Serpentine receptor class gamma [Caenorhabditis elegans]|uniref:Serpentine receptor class gamma n=1 Tax=Caenorhabditis elegans TaxID=6239 RepID=Q86GB9_CAEEL|nr:Serpentine receptor class gamma [Caenorhabditis elegans]CAD60424.2 Serpentine receptor class gamma [Caenorhabditis elegans]
MERCNQYQGDFAPLSFISAMSFHMAYVQYSLTTMVSLNRLTVLINHKVFEPIWKKFTWLFVVLIYFLPFLSTYKVVIMESEIRYSTRDIYVLVTPNLPFNDIYNILIPSLCILTVLSILFNAASVIFLRSLNIQRKKAESNFLIIMSITTLFQLIGAIVTVILLKFRTSIYPILSTIMPFVSDGLSLVQPWLLLFFSNAIRKEVKSIFGIHKKVQLVQVQSITN